MKKTVLIVIGVIIAVLIILAIIKTVRENKLYKKQAEADAKAVAELQAKLNITQVNNGTSTNVDGVNTQTPSNIQTPLTDSQLSQFAEMLYNCLIVATGYNFGVDSRLPVLTLLSQMANTNLQNIYYKYSAKYGRSLTTDIDNEIMPMTEIDELCLNKLRALNLK